MFGVSTVACVLFVGALVLKLVDYGWTAYDTATSAQTLANPSAAVEDKISAGANIILGVGLEALEPDDYFPVGIPADDIARIGIRQGIETALKEGGTNAALRYIKKNLGDAAIRQLYDRGVFSGIKSFSEWNELLMGVRQGAGLQVHHLIEERFATGLGIKAGDIPSVVLTIEQPCLPDCGNKQ